MRCAARPSRRARRALGSGTRAARRPSRSGQSPVDLCGSRRVRQAARSSRAERNVGNARRVRERRAGTSARPRACAPCSSARGARVRGRGRRRTRSAGACRRRRAGASELRAIPRSARGRRGTTGASRPRTWRCRGNGRSRCEAPQAVIRACAYSSSAQQRPHHEVHAFVEAWVVALSAEHALAREAGLLPRRGSTRRSPRPRATAAARAQEPPRTPSCLRAASPAVATPRPRASAPTQ